MTTRAPRTRPCVSPSTTVTSTFAACERTPECARDRRVGRPRGTAPAERPLRLVVPPRARYRQAQEGHTCRDEADHASPGSPATGSGSSSANGTRLPPSPAVRHRWEKKRVIRTPARNSPSVGSGRSPFASCQRELRVARARREWQRKSASKPRIYICDRKRAVRLAKALDVRRPDDADGLGDLTRVLDQLRSP